MKTFAEIHKSMFHEIFRSESLTQAKVFEQAAKEYAKMWVEEAVFWAEKQSEYGQPIINEVLPRIQKRIDEQ